MTTPEPANYLLSDDFSICVHEDRSVLNNPTEGFKQRLLPTLNHYLGEDGGYVAFYSRDRDSGVYPVSKDIFVVGQIRLKGRYIGRIFHPEGYEGKDLSAAIEFKQMCREAFGVEGWAGGDTGGWFGLE